MQNLTFTLIPHRNVPHLKIGKDIDPGWSSVLRTGAFAVLLLRAGLGLKVDILKRNKVKSLRVDNFGDFFIDLANSKTTSWV